MTRRTPARLRNSYDRYEIRTGASGFVLLIKNGKRIMPKRTVMRFNVRRERDTTNQIRSAGREPEGGETK